MDSRPAKVAAGLLALCAVLALLLGVLLANLAGQRIEAAAGVENFVSEDRVPTTTKDPTTIIAQPAPAPAPKPTSPSTAAPTTTTLNLTRVAKWETRQEPVPGQDTEQEVKAFIRYADGLRWENERFGPYAYDCAGLIGEVWNRVTNSKRYEPRWTDEGPDADTLLRQLGFERLSGRHTYASGPNKGKQFVVKDDRRPHAFIVGLDQRLEKQNGKTVVMGHTAGSFMGLDFEAANYEQGILVGRDAMNPRTMRWTYYLPMADAKYGTNFKKEG